MVPQTCFTQPLPPTTVASKGSGNSQHLYALLFSFPTTTTVYCMQHYLFTATPTYTPTHTGERSSTEAVASAPRVHWFLCHLAAHSGADVHVLHPGGLLQEALLRLVPTASPGAIPHVWYCSHHGLVGGVAAGIYEVTSAE